MRGYDRIGQHLIVPRVAMISTVTFDDERSNRWLDFSSAVIPNLGAQIPLPADWDIPFNIFWWGISQADLLRQVTSELVSVGRSVTGHGGFVRSVCYGSDWKDIIDNQPGELVIRDGTRAVRFEFVPDRPQTAVEVSGEIITWCRFHSYPRPDDPDAIESVGIMLPYRIFPHVTEFVVNFFEKTTVRTLQRSDVIYAFDRIATEFPGS